VYKGEAFVIFIQNKKKAKTKYKKARSLRQENNGKSFQGFNLNGGKQLY